MLYKLNLPVNILEKDMDQLCQNYHVMKLALFGSILRKDFSKDSDIDVLVEFEPGHTPGLAFFNLQQELSKLFGKPVDLNTKKWLSRYFRDDVNSQATPLYDKTRS